MSISRSYESAESASPSISRLVAGVLSGEHRQVFQFNIWERLGMHVLNQLPVSFAQSIVRFQFGLLSLSGDHARGLSIDSLVEQRLRDYQSLQGQFPVIIVGSALAGAAAHIASVLRGPFLPQPFILGLRGGAPGESIKRHIDTTTPVAEAVIERSKGVRAIAHFDPIHDGWLTRTVSHLRLKLIDLPAGYRSFIKTHLTPGGMILYLDCSAQWLQFPLSDRFAYQIGGWGGIPPEEYLTGSERIDRFLHSVGSVHRGGWELPGIDPEWALESEWGSEPGLDHALQGFANKHGYRFQRIRFSHPHDFSRLALSAHRRAFEQAGISLRGILIEMFTQYDPFAVLELGLLPLWLIFNTEDSRAFLMETLDLVPRELPIYFSGLATLSKTPDMVSWEGWISAFQEREWVNVGAGPRRYPEDLVALFRWTKRLQGHFRDMQPNSLPGLAIKDFLDLIPVDSISTC